MVLGSSLPSKFFLEKQKLGHFFLSLHLKRYTKLPTTTTTTATKKTSETLFAGNYCVGNFFGPQLMEMNAAAKTVDVLVVSLYEQLFNEQIS